MRNFWNLCQWPSFMSIYGNFEHRPISRKLCPQSENKLNFDPHWQRVYVELWPMAKFHANYGNFGNQLYLRNRCPYSKNNCQIANFDPLGQKERLCATSGTFPSGQVSCPNMVISKIGLYLGNRCLQSENQALFEPCGIERVLCATSGTFANGQISCPNVAILKINPYVNEPKFYTGTFDLLVFKVILGSFGALVSKWPVTRKQLTENR